MQRRHLTALILSIVLASSLHATEIIQLDESNYDFFVPKGKEVDAILGDTLLSNDKIIAVIAKPSYGRHANLTVQEVAGCLIDLTRKDSNNDQLSAFYPNAARTPYRMGGPDKTLTIFTVNNDLKRDREELEAAADHRAKLKIPENERAAMNKSRPIPKVTPKPTVTTSYTLQDGWEYVLVATTFENRTDKDLTIPLTDGLRADKTFDQSFDADLGLMWVYDRWFNQAYGFVVDTKGVAFVPPPATATPARNISLAYETGGKKEITLAPGEQFTLKRRIIPGDNLFQVRAIAAKLAGAEQTPVTFRVKDDRKDSVTQADVVVYRDAERKSLLARGRSDDRGRIQTELPAGQYYVSIFANGRTTQEFAIDIEKGKPLVIERTMDSPGFVFGKITNEKGEPTPCKVQFIGIAPTKDPFFFVDSGEHQVHNCRYSDDGDFNQPIAPGKYKAIISHGPEYDAAFIEIEVFRGQTTELPAQLVRSVDTKGWISADFHSHSSPSGDNTSSQFGRVLNLLAEHIEFAPCTEHQRIDSYMPHLKRLKVEHLMATCTGMELTGQPLPMNHQNVFPLIHKPRTQDGGGPIVDDDPRVQIERVYMWDNKSEKVVQQNHPDIIKMFFDADSDKKLDKGYDMAPFMNVIEVHPPAAIFQGAESEYQGKKYRNTIFTWMQTLNHGYRVPGVVNTDAHYNFHGSGWLRNWIKSPTDDPAQAKIIDLVRETNKGHLVMSTGPFLEVAAADRDNELRVQRHVLPGDDLSVRKGWVRLRIRVQCPNWFDVNRVQVFVNGRPDAAHNYTRKTHPKMFGDTAVKFNHGVDVELMADAHIIVATIGEGLTLGPVMGPQWGKEAPVAVSIPIFVDVDGNGFKANGDDLDAPLK